MNIINRTAEEDFAKARNKALFNEIQHFLSPEEVSLISLNDVKQLLKPTAETYVGMKVIQIEKIVGSEGRNRQQADRENHACQDGDESVERHAFAFGHVIHPIRR